MNRGMNNNKLIKCIAEIGLIILLNINHNIYLGGYFHMGFLNNNLTDKPFYDYLPHYHEYMSVENNTYQKIFNIEQSIYPHLNFLQHWNNFIIKGNQGSIKFNDLCDNLLNIFSDELLSIKMCNEIYIKYKDQLKTLISLIGSDNYDHTIENEEINILLARIEKNLKSIIYVLQIYKYKQDDKFKKINELYLEDPYIKKILINKDKQKDLINIYYDVIYSNYCINIIKGEEDVLALKNHFILINDQFHSKSIHIHSKKSINYIDIANYNDKFYSVVECNSAKLYETYLCLFNPNNDDKYYSFLTANEPFKQILENELIKFTSDIKPHNPLSDAFYTLNVFIKFNLLINNIKKNK